MYCIVSDTTSAVSIARGGVRAWKVYQSRDVNAVRQTPMCVNQASMHVDACVLGLGR